MARVVAQWQEYFPGIWEALASNPRATANKNVLTAILAFYSHTQQCLLHTAQQANSNAAVMDTQTAAPSLQHIQIHTLKSLIRQTLGWSTLNSHMGFYWHHSVIPVLILPQEPLIDFKFSIKETEYLFSPSLNSIIAFGYQLSVEKAVEEMDLGQQTQPGYIMPRPYSTSRENRNLRIWKHKMKKR